MAHRSARVLLMLSVAGLAWAQPRAADKVSDLQARFDVETNSVHQAKLFQKLGDAQFAETRTAFLENDYKTVGQIMEKYRDNAKTVLAALKKQHPDAERQMGGYKQLQMHIYKGLRELDETLLVSPPEFKPPLQLVRDDLVSMDSELLQLLFPHRAEKKKGASRVPAPPEKHP